MRKCGIGEIVRLGGEADAADCLAIGETCVEPAGFVEQLGARFLLDLLPKLISIADERHVVGEFLVGQPNNAGITIVE